VNGKNRKGLICLRTIAATVCQKVTRNLLAANIVHVLPTTIKHSKALALLVATPQTKGWRELPKGPEAILCSIRITRDLLWCGDRILLEKLIERDWISSKRILLLCHVLPLFVW
jgi:hypothetical protein